MKTLVVALPGNEEVANALAARLSTGTAQLSLHQFPDGEVCVQVLGPVETSNIILVSSLNRPDLTALPLYLASETLRDLGAQHITLVAPYLAYMRQDTRFHPGEGITARYFARWLSSFADALITVDPHLHRIHELTEVYSITALHVAAAPVIARWVKSNITKAVLIGPDAESEQWVSEVARDAGCAFTVLQKTRRGDRDVSVSMPDVDRWRGYTPVLVDDIISTGRTMIAAIEHIKGTGLHAPVCIGVHAVFAGTAYEDILAAGASEVITCNTIRHASNAIDIGEILVDAIRSLDP